MPHVDTDDAALGERRTDREDDERSSGTHPRLRRRVLPILLGVALVAAVSVSGFQMYTDHRDAAARQEALDTARAYSIAMSTFDYRNLDANMGAIAAMSTDEFAGTYRNMIDSLREMVAGGQGGATALVSNIAVESIDDSAATVLVFADQATRNITAPQGNTQTYRLVISLVRSDDHWLVDHVETK